MVGMRTRVFMMEYCNIGLRVQANIFEQYWRFISQVFKYLIAIKRFSTTDEVAVTYRHTIVVSSTQLSLFFFYFVS